MKVLYSYLSAEASKGEEFDKVKAFIEGTSTSTVNVDYIGRNPFKKHETVVKYGTLRVTQSQGIMTMDKYVPAQYRQQYKHQRMK